MTTRRRRRRDDGFSFLEGSVTVRYRILATDEVAEQEFDEIMLQADSTQRQEQVLSEPEVYFRTQAERETQAIYNKEHNIPGSDTVTISVMSISVGEITIYD